MNTSVSCAASTTARARRRWHWLSITALLLGALLVLAGCFKSTPPPPPPPASNCPANMQTVKLSPGINADDVAFDHKETHLSKGKHEGLQWQNTTGEDLLLFFVDSSGNQLLAAGIFVPKNGTSGCVGVCEGCGTGFKSIYHTYHFKGGSWVPMTESGPPGDPQVDVDN